MSGSSVSEGMRIANEMRSQWLVTLSKKETTLDHIISLSRTDDYRALSKIRILSILESCDGWTKRTAIDALSHYDIGIKDTIQSIRRNKNKIAAVESLIKSNPKLWRPRPRFPEGWPFFGKLSHLYDSMENTDIPEELLSILDDDNDASPEEALATLSDNESFMDNLEDLMGD